MKNLKEYVLNYVCAAALASLVLFVLWVLSLISWAIVWAILLMVAIPVIEKASDFYKAKRCHDIEDFFIALEKEFNKKSKNDIEW